MPQIELKGEAEDFVWMMAVMMFPNDSGLRDSMYSLKVLSEEVRGMRDSDKIELDVQTLKRFLEGKSKQEMRVLELEAGKRGIYAGFILGALYLMSKFPDEHPSFKWPSIKKAIHFCREFAISSTGKYGDGEKMPYSEQKIRQCWDEFKSVAHLWGALVLNDAYQFMESPWPSNRDDLTMFLSVAADLYQFGASYIPKGATPPVPVLSVDDAWTVPESIKPSALISSRPPDLLMKYMASYKHGS